MKFSLSKKNDIKDPQGLAQSIERSLNEINEVLQNAQAEKADLHSLLASAANERSQMLSAGQTVETVKQGISDARNEFIALKNQAEAAMAQKSQLESYPEKMAVLEKRLTAIAEGVERKTVLTRWIKKSTASSTGSTGITAGRSCRIR